jgi:hypothetical protein
MSERNMSHAMKYENIIAGGRILLQEEEYF